MAEEEGCENCASENGMVKEQLRDIVEGKMIEVNKIYINNLRETLKLIDEMEKKTDLDRLAYANIINHLVGILAGSIQGWQKWCNLNSMDTLLSLEELKEITPKMKALVTQWIEMDISITEKKTSDAEKEHQSKKTKKNKSKVYVS